MKVIFLAMYSKGIFRQLVGGFILVLVQVYKTLGKINYAVMMEC